MTTYLDVLRSYSRTVDTGHSDTDLTGRERRLVAVLLNLASNAGCVVYPPTDQTRADVAKYLGDIVWNARPLVEACGPRALADSFERAHERAVEIIRNV